MTIPCLTLTEPWASLVMLGEKRIETRGWATDYRGVLAIHAAKGMTGNDLDAAHFGEIFTALWRGGINPRRWRRVKDAFPETRGHVIAVAQLVACLPMERLSFHENNAALNERAFGDFSPGRYAWILDAVRRLTEPIPARGELGIWQWQPPDGWEMPS